MFHSSRGSGGVAILLGRAGRKAWQQAGSPDPTYGGTGFDNTTRFMGISLDFRHLKHTEKLFIGNVYAPSAEHEVRYPGCLDRYFGDIEEHITTKLSQGRLPIIGGDFNAKVGVRTNTDDQPVIGPHGFPQSNDCGERVLRLARTTELRLSGSFYKHARYDTFTDVRNDRVQCQLDHFLTSQTLGNQILESHRYEPPGDIISDHAAILCWCCLSLFSIGVSLLSSPLAFYSIF
jgi:exonuclease III